LDYLIAGVDPGATTAVALLDFDGNLIACESRKGWGLEGVISYILSHGKPSVIATDVSPTPSFVSKIASSFGVVAYSPNENLSVGYKQDLTRSFRTLNAHEMDSLACALNAYKNLQNKIRNLKSKNAPPEAIHMVLQGVRHDRALEKISQRNVPRKKPEKRTALQGREAVQKPDFKSNVYAERVNFLECELSKRENEVRLLKDKNAGLKREMHLEFKKDEKIQVLLKNIKSLKKRLRSLQKRLKNVARLKKMVLQASAGEVMAIPEYPLVNNGLTVLRGNLPKDFSEDDVKIMFTDDGKAKRILEARGVAVYETKMLDLTEGLYWITAEKIEKMGKSRRVSLEKIIEEYQKK